MVPYYLRKQSGSNNTIIYLFPFGQAERNWERIAKCDDICDSSHRRNRRKNGAVKQLRLRVVVFALGGIEDFGAESSSAFRGDGVKI